MAVDCEGSWRVGQCCEQLAAKMEKKTLERGRWCGFDRWGQSRGANVTWRTALAANMRLPSLLG